MSNEVISTRVRLARNLKDYPFPCRLSEQGRKKVIEKVTSAIRDSNSSIASDFNLIKLDDLTEAQGVSLVERHLVSPEFISETEGRALLLSKDESMSIMINEEDHIRLSQTACRLNRHMIQPISLILCLMKTLNLLLMTSSVILHNALQTSARV